MDWLDALILGLVQGLAEFLPISSSGHLEIFRDILGLQIEGAKALNFDIALHIATVLSTLVVLWKEFVPLVTSFFGFKRDANTLYVWKLLVSCIPIMIVGLLFKDTIEGFFGESLTVVGICLLATASLLAFAYFFRTRPVSLGRPRKERDITFLDAFIIGIAQSIAVLPGLSRSGSTIATGIMLGDKRTEVARFSFFMVIIPILGEAILDCKDIFGGAANDAAAASVGWLPVMIGAVTSFVVGCIACKWMIEIVKKGKLIWFALYCLLAGVACLVF